MAAESFDALEPLFWSRVVNEHLLHAYIMHGDSVDMVRVVKAESSEPMVWQARANKTIEAGKLVLVPWVKTPLQPLEDGKIPFQRAGLHPALPGHAKIRICAGGTSDETTLVARSPLDGKVKAEDKAAAPFWCVLSAGEGDASAANMVYRELQWEVEHPAVTIHGRRKKRN